MKIILAPDTFKGSISAVHICKTLSNSIKTIVPGSEIISIPVSDGGEGFIESLSHTLSVEIVSQQVTGPLGKPVRAIYGILGRTAYLEMAQTSGLQLLNKSEYNPFETTTYGLGELIKKLLKDGISNFTVGIGGSATNDGGAGMAQALGYEFYDQSGNIITEKMNGRLIGQISKIVSPILPYFRIKAAGDVKNPLLGKHGAVYTYATQKGATLADLPVLEKNMANLSACFHKDLCRKIDNIEGAGAAGGLGAGLMAFCDAEIVSGSQHILRILNFHDKIKNAGLVITGEGKYDDQTSQGKIVSEIVRISKKNKVPVYGIFGKIDTSAKGQFEKCMQLVDFADETETIKNPKKYLEMAIKNIFIEKPE